MYTWKRQLITKKNMRMFRFYTVRGFHQQGDEILFNPNYSFKSKIQISKSQGNIYIHNLNIKKQQLGLDFNLM